MTVALSGFATGIGSMPEMPTSRAAQWVVDHFPELPHLVELPSRGIWSGMIGRAGALLSGMAMDLTANGWRITSSPGSDQRKIEALLQSDIDALEDALAGEKITIKTQVVGPWTLAAAVEGRTGRRLLQDHGACRDLAQSLADGVAEHIERLLRIGATTVIVQVDEPSITAIRRGSGGTLFSQPRIPEDFEIAGAWAHLRARWGSQTPMVLHSCADDLPWSLAGTFDAVSVDGTREHDEQGLGQWLDRGRPVWWGALAATDTDLPEELSTTVRRVRAPFERLGFGDRISDRIALTPACGFAGVTLPAAERIARRLQDVRLALLEGDA